MNLAPLSLEPQALTVFGLWLHGLSYYHVASNGLLVMPTIAVDIAGQEYNTKLSSACVLRGSNFKGGD